MPGYADARWQRPMPVKIAEILYPAGARYRFRRRTWLAEAVQISWNRQIGNERVAAATARARRASQDLAMQRGAVDEVELAQRLSSRRKHRQLMSSSFRAIARQPGVHRGDRTQIDIVTRLLSANTKRGNCVAGLCSRPPPAMTALILESAESRSTSTSAYASTRTPAAERCVVRRRADERRFSALQPTIASSRRQRSPLER